MPPDNLDTNECRVYGSVTNYDLNQKAEVVCACFVSGDENATLTGAERSRAIVGDRFISNRPKLSSPLNTTPRTNRICKQRRNLPVPQSGRENNGPSAKEASSLFNLTPPLRPTSADTQAFLSIRGISISWSPRNLIAVICVKSVFYQNLDTKAVTRRLGVIEWGHENHDTHIATGMSLGIFSIFHGMPLRSRTPHKDPGVKSLSWNRDVLAPNVHTKLVKHHGRVSALEWSADRTHLASGDSNGIVLIWDSRNTREPLSKLRHKGSTRPVHTLALNTSVLSLQWSPHCKELLSTHGRSFVPPPPPPPPRRAISWSGKLTYTETPFTNSITVHAYPSGKCLMTLTNAHAGAVPNVDAGAVTQSCLSPSGESVFTVCPGEETLKMWQVWSKRVPAPKPESAFDRFTIR
ncbi:WD40-repeat-containing domain protein [Pholiota molesta]|nr:WD40-repeat-containing domain protein [Pholiota molesta]